MSRNGSVDAANIAERLRSKFAPPEWICFAELRPGPGFDQQGIIDFAALSGWESSGLRLVAVEVKVDRADWRRELAKPEKSAHWREIAQQFWIAAPRGVVPVEELPEGWGLLETWGADKLRAARHARTNPGAEIPRETWVMMLRDLVGQRQRIERRQHEFAEFAGKAISLDDLDKLAQHKHCRTCEWRTKQEIENKLRKERQGRLAQQEWLSAERKLRRWLDGVLGRDWDCERSPEEVDAVLAKVGDILGLLRRVGEWTVQSGLVRQEAGR